MIDLKRLRADPDFFRDSMRRRGSPVDLDAVIELDARHRRHIADLEELRAEQNRAGPQIAAASGPERESAIRRMQDVSSRLKVIEAERDRVRRDLESQLAFVPNLVHPQAPEGAGDEANVLIRRFGSSKEPGFAPRDHLDIGEGLGIIDAVRGAKVAGSRFAFLVGKGALLELGLVRLAMETLAPQGFVPVIPPVLVKEEAMFGTGFFPTDEAQVYKTASDELFLAGTAEVPIAAMHAGEVLPGESLPARYAGFSTCFRREAGSYGRDVRGIIRVHQFDKVEMFSFCEPGRSEEEHDLLVGMEEQILQSLEIPYRLIEICAGDLAAPNYRKFDIEAWLPGSNRWLEVTSCSNDLDYQARRLGIRSKTSAGTEHVHTLNGTALAVQRTLVALLENHQRSDGSVLLPAALQGHAGFEEILPATG